MSQCCEATNEKNACCETECCDAQSQCPTGSSHPLDCSTGLWESAFHDAMHQAQVDLLKSKITKAWGPMMDKAAEAMIATAGVKWESMIASVRAAEASHAFRDTLRDLWLDAKK